MPRRAFRGELSCRQRLATSADIPIRGQRNTMERPFFSLTKKLRFTRIEYHVGDAWVEVSANFNSAGPRTQRLPSTRNHDYSPAMQKRCFSPRIKIRFVAGTGEPMTDSAMLFSDKTSNLSLATLATNTVPSSRGA